MTTVSVVLVLFVAGLSSGLGHGLATRDSADTVLLVGAALAYAPAALAVTAVVSLGHGLSWSASVLGWLALGWCAVIGIIGPLLDLPTVVSGLSPFEHVARMPADSFDAVAWVLLWCVALALSAVGQALLTLRDLS